MDPSPPDSDAGSPAGRDYRALERDVQQAERRHARLPNPMDRAIAYGKLLQVLGEHVSDITAERDAALIEVLSEPEHPSHRALATALGLSRQRVDQLAAIAARGGRPRRAITQ